MSLRTELSEKLTLRYFARLGVFRSVVVYSLRADLFLMISLTKQNLYWRVTKIGTKTLRRIRISVFDTHVQLFNEDTNTIEWLPTFRNLADRNNTPTALDCWKVHSDYIVYAHRENLNEPQKFALDYFNLAAPIVDSRINPFAANTYVDSHVLAITTGSKIGTSHSLILPWFDRLDRLIFWKCFETSMPPLSSFANLIIHVHNYL
jgi:hypothetical protein